MDLGLVDIEWADGEGGGPRKSVLEAVSRVRFESVLPVRRFTSYRGQRHFTGWYWAATSIGPNGYGWQVYTDPIGHPFCLCRNKGVIWTDQGLI